MFPGAQVPLQNLLQHTATRLLHSIKLSPEVRTVQLVCKWGADGSSGYSEYMQKPTDSLADDTNQDSNVTDANLFLMTLVPLRLIGLFENCNENNKNENQQIVWQNPRPSSTRLCRPIKFLYEKETAELIRQEIAAIETEISNLSDFDILIQKDGHEFNVKCKFIMHLTMLDVKAINALTDNKSTQTCYLCKSKPTEMNNLRNKKHTDINVDNLKYGLTTLHAWIKFLELALHVSYKLELQKPTIRGITSEQAATIETRKKRVHHELHQKMGIRVDKVVQGKGTSNTGNVARIFFENYKDSASITGVDENLIRRFGIILIALSSGYSLNITNFNNYAKDTANLYVEKYSWYRMPVSVHKILIHGSAVAEAIILPIGMMSEEAQEASNKIYRQVRDRHTRKCSRIDTTTDLMKMMLQQTDPIIAQLRGLPKKCQKELPDEVLPLLVLDSLTKDDKN